MKLIFVHGRSQGGKNAEELRFFWEGGLDKSFREAGLRWPAGVEVFLPYYADDLDRMVQQVNGPLIANIGLRGDSAVSSPEALRVEMIHEILAEQTSISEDQVLAHFAGQPAGTWAAELALGVGDAARAGWNSTGR